MTAGGEHNFIVLALRGQPLTLYGDGSQTHSSCYVDQEAKAEVANGVGVGAVVVMIFAAGAQWIVGHQRCNWCRLRCHATTHTTIGSM